MYASYTGYIGIYRAVGYRSYIEAVSIFQLLCVAEFPLEDADQTFRIELTMGRGGALIATRRFKGLNGLK